MAAEELGQGARLGCHAAMIAVALVGLACLTHTRHALSGTFDESNHLAAGLEWWQFGSYSQWTENPPLPRVAVAFLPYLHGMRLPPPASWDPRTHDWDRSWEIGNDMLYGGDGFETNLGRARLGTLPFFLVAVVAAWGLAGGRRRPIAGLVAVALTATLPPLIAHGALATTDVAFVAMFLLASLGLARWFDAPTPAGAVAVGAAVGLALLTKFSTLVFFPVAVVAFAVARRWVRLPVRPVNRKGGRPLGWRALAGHAGLALLGAFFVTWAGYRFSVGRIDDLPAEVKDWLPLVPPVAQRTGLGRWFLHARLPMPELWHGLRFLAAHNADGHSAYLLGRNADRGFVAFYPIALAVKTPLALLISLLLALPWLARRRPELARAQAVGLAACGILLVSLASHINIGIRHVFVLLPLLAIAAGIAADDALAAARGRRRLAVAAAVAVLVCAQSGVAIAARDTALGYFNPLAGRDPAAVLLDSDLDWGQDLFALRREARARGIDTLSIAYFGMLRQCQHELPHLTALVPRKPTVGWVAISENYYRDRSFFRLHRDPCDAQSRYRSGEVTPGAFAWLKAYPPVAIVGSSIRLYHIPE
jgi:4-amino-4-deoxy-L-arabinose transferase-like glycosyltransferase